MAYSCMGKPQTTIGAGGLNFRVRDGTGCTSTALITNKLSLVNEGATAGCAACLARVRLPPDSLAAFTVRRAFQPHPVA